jgi:anti-anti-sigma factor
MAAGLEIKLTTIAGDDLSALAAMTGAIDGNTVPSFQATLEEIKTKGIRRLVLDMSKIKYVNSTGLGSLVKYADTFKSTGGGMALIKVPAKVKIVIEMLGLNAFFDICTDLESALKALENSTVAAPAETKSTTSKPPRLGKRGASGPSPVQTPSPVATPTQTRPASGGVGFPQNVACQGCGVQVEVATAGNWKCPRCFTFITAKPGGAVSFGRGDNKPAPVNLSLSATKECGEGLVHLVTSVCSTAVNGPKLEALRIAVHEVAQVMQQSVYQNNPQGVYHVSIEREQGRVQIRIADSGATIEGAMANQFFPHSSSQLSEFECRPHPSGGNTIRLLQRA